MKRHESAENNYECIADEYYDASRHPTCFNFGELSERFIAPLLLRDAHPGGQILDLGAGRSVAAAVLWAAGAPLNSLVILDSSPSMLAHSADWARRGARTVLADARETGLERASFDIIVASLGDPYNQTPFWAEVTRLLRPGGRCLFTTPTSEWSKRFRAGSNPASAEFLTADGGKVYVPSYTLPAGEQAEMIRDSGLVVSDTRDYFQTDLRSAASAKIKVEDGGGQVPIVRGYAVLKRLG